MNNFSINQKIWKAVKYILLFWVLWEVKGICNN